MKVVGVKTQYLPVAATHSSSWLFWYWNIPYKGGPVKTKDKKWVSYQYRDIGFRLFGFSLDVTIATQYEGD